MKIIMYDTHQHERPYAQIWAQAHHQELTMVEEPLTMETVHLAEGYDGLSVQQTIQIDNDIYPMLANYGINHISTRTAGFDNFDLAVAKQHGITITNIPSYSPRAIAEMGLTQAMYLLRNIGPFHEQMDQNHDFTWSGNLISNEIYRCTVGLIGTGRIGTATAQIYKALGARVLAYDPRYHPELEPFVEFVDRDTILRQADIITLHTPLTPQTKNMIGAAELRVMKPTAILINVARGGLVDTQALIKALQDHEIAGAGLETLANEQNLFGHQVSPDQIPEDYKILRAMPNVIITPHVAFLTQTSVQNLVQISLDDTVKLAQGQRTNHAVN